MSANIGDVFKPGQKCAASGIYTVIHDQQHAEQHDVTVVYGEPFPPCNHCGPHPRFVAKYLATHVRNEKLFVKNAA